MTLIYLYSHNKYIIIIIALKICFNYKENNFNKQTHYPELIKLISWLILA